MLSSNVHSRICIYQGEGIQSTDNIKQNKRICPRNKTKPLKPTSERILVPWFGTKFSSVLQMSKALLFRIVKQILVNHVIHNFYEKRFLVK